MENYQLLVDNMAKQREEKDVKLVLNLFQTLLDEFARSYAKKELEHPKVCRCLSLCDLSWNCRVPCKSGHGLSTCWLGKGQSKQPLSYRTAAPSSSLVLVLRLNSFVSGRHAWLVQPTIRF